jgi:hypothetical protein
MIRSDSLTKFAKLRRSLETERVSVMQRLQEINQVLGISAPAQKTVPKLAKGRKAGRGKNVMSLKAAMLKASAKGAMTKQELLVAVKDLGYHFKTGNPINSINALLYAKGSPFKNSDGKFSAA